MYSKDKKTYEKLMDCAEKIFAEKGYDKASVREITAAANVNLASIHYHFGSKENLLQELLNRKLEWLNQQRLIALKTLESKSKNKPLKPSQILEAFFGTFGSALNKASLNFSVTALFFPLEIEEIKQLGSSVDLPKSRKNISPP